MVVQFARRSGWGGGVTGEENFTPGEFTVVNMKNGGSRNVSKQRDINDSDNYITLDILLKFGSLDKMIIMSSEPKYNLGISGKGLITSLSLKSNAMPKKYEKSRYAIRDVSMKKLSKIIREFKHYCLIKFMRG